ncbi:hypothetical protein DXG01_008460 [Tephrocybe rancida]|nr:hypothetical protein DXG01_008460 [Tephrocybe rancida]
MADLRLRARIASTTFEPSSVKFSTSHYDRPQTFIARPSHDASLLGRIAPPSMTAINSWPSGHGTKAPEALVNGECASKSDFALPAYTTPLEMHTNMIPAAASVTEKGKERHVEGADIRDGVSSNNGTSSTAFATGQMREHMNMSSNKTQALDPLISAHNTVLSKETLLGFINSIHFQSALRTSNQLQLSAMPPGQLRDMILPVLVQNVQRRPGSGDAPVEKVEHKLREALTDRVCETLATKMKTIHQEMQARGGPPGGERTSNLADPSITPEPPKAPRAMRGVVVETLRSRTPGGAVVGLKTLLAALPHQQLMKSSRRGRRLVGTVVQKSQSPRAFPFH